MESNGPSSGSFDFSGIHGDPLIALTAIMDPSWWKPCFSTGRPWKAWNIPYFSGSHLGYVVIWVAVGTSGLSGDQLVKSHMSRSAVSHVFSRFLMFLWVPNTSVGSANYKWRVSQYALEDAGSEIFWADTPGHNDALWFLMVSSCLLGKCLQDGFGCEPHMEDHGSHQVSTGRDMLKKEMRRVLELRRIEKMGHDGSWWVPFASRHLSKESKMQWNPLKLCNVQQVPHWFNSKISPEDTALPHRWHRPVNQYLQSPMLTPDNLHISPHWQTLDCNDTSHNMFDLFDLICNFKIHNHAALIQLTILRAHRAQCDFDIQSIFKAKRAIRSQWEQHWAIHVNAKSIVPTSNEWGCLCRILKNKVNVQGR